MMNQTPLGKDEQKRLTQIVQQLMDAPDSLEFRQPVDYKALQLNDYPDIIKTPMDLGTCSKKLQANKYRTVEECLDDIQLIWDNCKTYNAFNSWIWKLADKLEKSFKKYVKNYLPLVNVPQPKRDQNIAQKQPRGTNENYIFTEEQTEVISYNEKVEFANTLKQLQPEEIGLIVHMLQNGCPNAFVEVDKERYQIIVDNIDSDIFKKCQKQMEELLTKDKSVKKLKL